MITHTDITQGPAINYTTLTKAQADTAITNSTLIPGTLYKITGCANTGIYVLYNDGTSAGTDIFLTAIAVNKFSSDGIGIFYNPKYNQAVSGFNVWSNRNTWVTSSVVGVFNGNEAITANNGATGTLFTSIEANIFIALTGSWAAATSITGSVTGATANVGTIALKTYAIGAKTIWGHYSWTNVNGNVGARTDIRTLNSEWTKDTYSLTNYNIAYDAISYDYINDYISRRYEAGADNLVEYSYGDRINQAKGNAISAFMWGNAYSSAGGIGGNRVLNSYVECVDFCGAKIHNNIFMGYSDLLDNTFTGTSNIYLNTFLENSNINLMTCHNTLIYNNHVITEGFIGSCICYSVSINDNFLSGYGGIVGNTLVSSNVQLNQTSGDAYIYNNKVYNSDINHNTLVSGARFQTNVLTNTDLIYNNLSASNLQNCRLTNCFVQYCSFENSSTLDIGLGTTITSKTFQYITFEGGTINVDVSAATIIYGAYSKTVYTRPDGTFKLRYYNNSDALVITAITT